MNDLQTQTDLFLFKLITFFYLDPF